MKIVVIEPNGKGGLAHFAYELCQALQDEGHEISLVTSTNSELIRLPHRFAIAPIMRLWPPVDEAAPQRRRRKWYRAFARARRVSRGVRLTVEWMRVTRKLVREKPDAVIFSEMAFPHLAFAPRAMRRAKITTCQICHEYVERDSDSRILTYLSLRASNYLFRQFNQIFFLSQATRREFLDNVPFDVGATSCIPHGSQDMFGPPRISERELKLDLGIADHEPVALYFGYIRPSKGIPDLLEAYSLSSFRHSSRLVVAGHVTKFSDVAQLKEKAQELGLSDRVIFNTTYIPNDQVKAYFEMARVVVLPYRSASQSGVLHLAYGQSRPVIATAVGGLSEDVIDGETGLLVPARNVRAMAMALDRLLGDAELARELGCRAKELAKSRFTWSAAAQMMLVSLQSKSLETASAQSPVSNVQVKLDT